MANASAAIAAIVNAGDCLTLRIERLQILQTGVHVPI
jgi:hypothetical protein